MDMDEVDNVGNEEVIDEDLTPMSAPYRVKFCSVNDNYTRNLIVCVDKTWGTSGCQPWTGDWVATAALAPDTCLTTPPFTPTSRLTAVTSSSSPYRYRVEFLDSNGNVVHSCNNVDRNNPCYLNVTPPTPTPTPTSGECSPVVRTGVEFLDKVLFCAGNVGITVFVLLLFFGFLLLLLLLRRRR